MNESRPVVTLRLDEQRLVEFMALWRQLEDDNAGIHDGRCDKNKTSRRVHAEGFGGEYAFCKYNNICADFTTTPRKGGYDCLLHDRRFDVKAVAPGRNLVVSASKDYGECDYYALVICEYPKRYTIAGVAAKKDLLVPRRINHNLPKPAYFMHQGELIPLCDFLRSIGSC